MWLLSNKSPSMDLMLGSARGYFLLSLLQASSMDDLTQAVHALVDVSLSINRKSWKAVCSTKLIFRGSSLAFPKTPLTMDDFISSLLKSSLTKLAHIELLLHLDLPPPTVDTATECFNRINKCI